MRRLAVSALPLLLLAQCTPAADGAGVPGDCASYADDMAAAGLPVATFTRIGWRETGCNPWTHIVDSDDNGGFFFGLNFRGSMAGYWRNLCGATLANIAGNVPLIMDCAAAEYRAHGLRAWS